MKATVQIESKFEVGCVVQPAFDRYYYPADEKKKNSQIAKVLKIDFYKRENTFYYLCEYDNDERMWIAECNLKGSGEGIHVNI